MTENKRISQAIKEAFGENVTDEQAAKELGTNVKEINRCPEEWNGTTLARLSNAAHVSIEWLMGRTDERVPANARDYHEMYVSFEGVAIEATDILEVAVRSMKEVLSDIEGNGCEVTNNDLKALYGIVRIIERAESELNCAIG